MSQQITAASDDSSQRRPTSGGGLFSLYKSGQGYWTRLGTALAAGGVVLFIAYFVYSETSVFSNVLGSKSRRYGLAAVTVALLALVVWWVMNAPKRAQFLIDTDSEMKKVNWATWSELIGSTRVVVFFMLLTAVALFIFDTQFHALFYSLGVWHIAFDRWMGLITGVLLAVVLLATGFGLLRGGAEKTKAAHRMGMASLIAGAAVLVAWVLFAVRTFSAVG